MKIAGSALDPFGIKKYALPTHPLSHADTAVKQVTITPLIQSPVLDHTPP